MKLLYIFLALLLLSCGQGNKKGKDPFAKQQQIENSGKTSSQAEPSQNLNEDHWEAAAKAHENRPKEISIQNLYKAMEDRDEEEFLRQFPKNFQQFQGYFGWDVPNDAPHELYEHSVHYIEYLFYLLRTNKYPSHEKNIITICENGQWEADAVNYFQHHVLNHIKENEKYYMINELGDDKAKSVLFFLFDGPHPKFDADFASQLSPIKQKILEALFERGFYDDNENPEIIEVHPVYLDPIDYEGSIHYTVSDFENNEHYFIREIDINKDYALDKVISAEKYQGDELFLFLKKGDGYQFALKTTNFSADGGNQIVDVVAEDGGFFVKTAFLDGGLLEAYHHITFKDGHWVLTNSVYKTQSSNQEDAFIFVCDVEQGIDLADADLPDKLKWLPNEKERERSCTKEMK